MIWIIDNHEELKYDTRILNSDWLMGGSWYNTSICKKLQGKLFEGFLINAYEIEHQSYSCDDGSISGICPILITSTTKALESLGETINVTCCWLKALEHNILECCNFYTHYME